MRNAWLIMMLLIFSCSRIQTGDNEEVSKNDNDNVPKGTTWVYHWDEDHRYADSIVFKDSLYHFYSSEIQGLLYGEYYYDDMYFLELKGEVWSSKDPPYVPFKQLRGIREIVAITEDKLYFIKAQELKDSGWVDMNFKYGDNYIFKKLKSR